MLMMMMMMVYYCLSKLKLRAMSLDAALSHLQIYDRQLLHVPAQDNGFGVWPPPNDHTRCAFCLGASAARRSTARSLTAVHSSLCTGCACRAADGAQVGRRIWDLDEEWSTWQRRPGTNIRKFMPPADLDCRGMYLKLPIHVATLVGNDDAEGTERYPVKTLARAAKLVKALDIKERQYRNIQSEPFGGAGLVPMIKSDLELPNGLYSPAVIRMHCSGNGCSMKTCSHPSCHEQLCAKHGAGIGYWVEEELSFLEWQQQCMVDSCDAWYCDEHALEAPTCESCQLSTQNCHDAPGDIPGVWSGCFQLCPVHANTCMRSYHHDWDESDDDGDYGYYGEFDDDGEPWFTNFETRVHRLKVCGVVCCPDCRHVGEECCIGHAKAKITIENASM
eukprot:SAG31_NODE_3410_length_4306_cov_1.893035_3_plen_390_part_00